MNSDFLITSCTKTPVYSVAITVNTPNLFTSFNYLGNRAYSSIYFNEENMSRSDNGGVINCGMLQPLGKTTTTPYYSANMLAVNVAHHRDQ